MDGPAESTVTIRTKGAAMNTGSPIEPGTTPEGGPVRPESYPPPQHSASDFDSQQRMWAMWCHLAAFATFIIPLGSVLGPLLVWLTKRQDYPLVDEEGKRALNFQITMAICFVVLFIVVFAGVVSGTGLVVAIAAAFGFILGIAWLVLVIFAAMRTNEGKRFHYPLSIRFLK